MIKKLLKNNYELYLSKSKIEEIRNLSVTYEKFNLEQAILLIANERREMLCLKKVFDLLDKLKENGTNFTENFDEMVIKQLKEKRFFIYNFI